MGEKSVRIPQIFVLGMVAGFLCILIIKMCGLLPEINTTSKDVFWHDYELRKEAVEYLEHEQDSLESSRVKLPSDIEKASKDGNAEISIDGKTISFIQKHEPGGAALLAVYDSTDSIVHVYENIETPAFCDEIKRLAPYWFFVSVEPW